MSTEKWHYHKGRSIASHLPNSPFGQMGQQYPSGIVTPITIDGNELEFFILDHPTNPEKIEGVDFDYVNLRIPAGFRNVEYTIQGGLIDQFDTQLTPPVVCTEGFFGVTLIHFRPTGQAVRPFVHPNAYFHHCDAGPQTRGRDCPNFISYGFEGPKTTDYSRLKIFFYQGEKLADGKYRLSKDSDHVRSDKGFYLVPLFFPDKSLLYGIISYDNDPKSPKDILNEVFFDDIKKYKLSEDVDILFMDTKDSVFRDDELSIYFKLIYDFRKAPEFRQRMNVGGCNMPE